jgi:hypothetical protein
MVSARDRILEGVQTEQDIATDRRVAMALGMLASAQASIAAAASLLAASNETVEPDEPGTCSHPQTQEVAAFGDGPGQVFCLRCGEQV